MTKRGHLRYDGPRGDDIPVCDECHERHVVTRTGTQACSGHVFTDRESYVKGQQRKPLDKPRPCGRSPLNGQTKCGKHGGDTPGAKANAERRQAERRAERAMRRFGGPIDTTPTEALLDAVRWTAGYVAWLREQIDQHADDESKDSSMDQAIESKLVEWTDLLRKVCGDAIRCGIEERRVRFAESQGQQVAEAIKGILGDLDLTAEQLARVGEVVPLHLRRLMHVA